MRLELPWPELASFPDYGLVRTRAGLRRACWPATPQKAGARLHERTTVTGPSSTSAPAGSPASRPSRRRRRTKAGATSPSARRSWSPPTASPAGSRSRWACSKRDDRPMGVAVRTLLHAARGTTTTSWSPGWSCGTASRPAERCCPATAGSSASATAPSNVGPRHPQHLRRPSARSTTRTCSTLARRARPRSGASARRTRPAPIRGAALPMGFNRTAALHPRAAAGRRRRRHGQPVQRRGHRLRDGVRRAGRRGRRAGAGADRRAAAASARCTATRGAEGRATAATTRWAACS